MYSLAVVHLDLPGRAGFKIECTVHITLPKLPLNQFTEVCFASFLSGGFINVIVVNPLERKLVKRTSVQCQKKLNVAFLWQLHKYIGNSLYALKIQVGLGHLQARQWLCWLENGVMDPAKFLYRCT